MSLYGERCGALSVVCADAAEASNVLGQLKFTVRRNYSSPPIHGGQIVAAVLTEPALRSDWEAELDGDARAHPGDAPQRCTACSPRRCRAATSATSCSQRGMFSYTGLSPRQVDRLREEFAVYLVRSGRMCVAGLNRGNVERDRAGDGRRARRLTAALRRSQRARATAGEAALREQGQAGRDAGEAVAAHHARAGEGARAAARSACRARSSRR